MIAAGQWWERKSDGTPVLVKQVRHQSGPDWDVLLRNGKSGRSFSISPDGLRRKYRYVDTEAGT